MNIKAADQKSFVCRCEDVTLKEVLKAIDEGFTSLEEIKRYLRCGMGICQGRICMKLIAKILATKTNEPIETILPIRIRPPLTPVSYAVFAGENTENKK